MVIGFSQKTRPVLVAGAIFITAGLLGGCASSEHRRGPSLAEAKAAFQRQDYWTAAQLLKPLAYQGNADAQYALGYMYYYGRGVEQNRSWAMSWFGEAVRLGHPKAREAVASLRSEARITRRPEQAGSTLVGRAQTDRGSARAGRRPEALPVPPAPVAERHPSGDEPVASPIVPTTRPPLPHPDTREPERRRGSAPAPRRPATPAPVSGTGESVAKFRAPRTAPAAPERKAPDVKAGPAPAPAVAKDDSAGKREPEPKATGPQVTLAGRPRFTLQLIGSRSKADLAAIVERYGLRDVRYLRSERQGGPWYRLLYRGFDSLADARRALKALPAEVGRHKPFVRNFPLVQVAALKRFD